MLIESPLSTAGRLSRADLINIVSRFVGRGQTTISPFGLKSSFVDHSKITSSIQGTANDTSSPNQLEFTCISPVKIADLGSCFDFSLTYVPSRTLSSPPLTSFVSCRLLATSEHATMMIDQDVRKLMEVCRTTVDRKAIAVVRLRQNGQGIGGKRFWMMTMSIVL